MRVLVTGGAGFIGSHLAESLQRDGADVVVLDNLSSGSQRVPGVTLVEGDVRDAGEVARVMGDVDMVFHLASVVGVQQYVENPRETIDVILHGTENVVDACVDLGVPMLLTSTSEVYGRTERLPMVEDAEIVYGATDKTRWSYGMAKALDEIIVLDAVARKGLDGRVVRLFNTVGPRQSGAYGMVMARFVQQAVRGEPLTVHGDGEQTRTFCYVDDTVQALKMAMLTPAARGVVMNVGGTEEITIRQLAERVIQLVESSSSIRYMDPVVEYGVGYEDTRRRQPSTARIEEIVGWRPTIAIDTMIRLIATHEEAACVPS